MVRKWLINQKITFDTVEMAAIGFVVDLRNRCATDDSNGEQYEKKKRSNGAFSQRSFIPNGDCFGSYIRSCACIGSRTSPFRINFESILLHFFTENRSKGASKLRPGPRKYTKYIYCDKARISNRIEFKATKSQLMFSTLRSV